MDLNRSILVDVRLACNVPEDDSSFDGQLIPLINSQLMIAHQFGVGHNGFNISGDSETWQDLLGDEGGMLSAMKTWLGYSVLLMFDPPDNGTVLKSYQDQITKLEWMLCSKSMLECHVKTYVPEHADLYTDPYADLKADEEDD